MEGQGGGEAQEVADPKKLYCFGPIHYFPVSAFSINAY
jgi:hypothetical protein